MDKDISKKTVALVLFCAILLSVFSTLMVLNKEPRYNIQRYETVGAQGQVGLTIMPAPQSTGHVGLSIIEPPKEEGNK